MLSLNTNAASLSAQNSLGASQRALSTSMSRLSTGNRVNSAMDDAAGLQIATRLDAQTRGQAVAMRNTQNGISMMQTAEGALNETTNILLRMKDLATQGADGTATAADKTAMQAEYDSLGKELNNIMTNTSFGGQTLFGAGTAPTGMLAASAGVTFQIGSAATERMTVSTGADVTGLAAALTTASSNYVAGATTAGTEVGAAASITNLDTAIAAVGTLRSSLGAASNRLDHVFNNLQNMSTNISQAKGRIMDTDYATETSTMTTKQMLMQAGSSMLKQANSMSGMVMSLLQ